MYNFIDVIEASEGYVLPSEALKINGVYIEDQISGYRTLSVSGREALSAEVETFSTGIRDGSKAKSKRFPERIITVKYQLLAESSEAFRKAYNKLGGILNVEDAELIFNDEQDKFFIGTPCTIEAVEPGRNSVVGEFEILCADPFKYSVLEYVAEPDLDTGSILIDYNGTYKSFPTLEADFHNETEVGDDGETAGSLTGNGDCGYVAFFTEDEKIVQLGDPDEVDTEGNYAKSQTRINQTFQGSTAWGTTAQKLWAVNSGNLQSNTVQTGSVAMAIASYAAESKASTTGTILDNAKSTYGSPAVYYTVKAKTADRTRDSVKVTFTITGKMDSEKASFGSGYDLVCGIYVGGAWKTAVIKKAGEKWSGTTAHTVNLTTTVSVSQTATAITGLKFKVYRLTSNVSGNAGVMEEKACSNLAILAYGAKEPESYYLTAYSYGTDSTHWHGPSITRQIGADAAGNVGAKNFTLTYRQKMCMGTGNGYSNQKGGFQMHLLSASGANIAGIRVYKNKAGKTGKLVFYVNGNIVNTTDIDLHYNNYYFGGGVNSVQTTTVTKTGGTITFAVGGYKRQFTVDALKDAVVTKLTFAFEQYPGSPFLSYNGLYWAKFVKNNCDTYKDIPNKFSANDVVTADCKNGEIRLNGVLSPDLGALGNDWEGFYLTPGLNQIGFSYSDWVAAGYEPNMKVRYREVFL
jgi:predicted phage tail component-like protein